jgi:hypothetical protein
MPIAESNGNLSKVEDDEGQVFTTTTGTMGSTDLNFKYVSIQQTLKTWQQKLRIIIQTWFHAECGAVHYLIIVIVLLNLRICTELHLNPNFWNAVWI